MLMLVCTTRDLEAPFVHATSRTDSRNHEDRRRRSSAIRVSRSTFHYRAAAPRCRLVVVAALPLFAGPLEAQGAGSFIRVTAGALTDDLLPDTVEAVARALAAAARPQVSGSHTLDTRWA